MIKNIKHKGLRAFHATGSKRGIQAKHEARLNEQLTALEAATGPQDLTQPLWHLHPLHGEWKGYFSLMVDGNVRLRFRFQGRDVADLDYIDYH